jgi:predicted nucleotidyltransferase component of viral defense system
LTRRPLKDVALSVRQRLLNQAQATYRPFNELLQYFNLERFLYRLAESPHRQNFVLKGALMLRVWRAPLSRPTMDIDLLGRMKNEPQAVIDVVRELCDQPVSPDGLWFDAESVESEPIAEDAPYTGVRVRLQSRLGTARSLLRVDVGFGDPIVPAAIAAEIPPILDFPAPQLLVYTRASAVAEKFEAMVKRGLLNSRMKDFFDIWLLSRQFTFDGEILSSALRATFAARETPVPPEPVALTSEFAADTSKAAQWRAFLRRSRLDAAPLDLSEVVDAVAEFLKPVAAALAAKRAFRGTWKPPGPWLDL